MTSIPDQTSAPPPLPPRPRSPFLSPDYHHSPPYSALEQSYNQVYHAPWNSQDPRSSSTQSLVPAESTREGRRTLMLIYIHGFMGDDASFKSFPAHIHNLLSVTLAETHVVHTKIYPRYKSRKVIEYARDDFSKWLTPHESSSTDIILIGHSMGGLLSAEVVLLPPEISNRHNAFRHQILGTINFDTPFLGLHPGVIISGLGSLFRPGVEPTKQKGELTSTESLLSTSAKPPDLAGSSDRTDSSTPHHSPNLSLASLVDFDSDGTSLTPTASMTTLSPFTSPLADPNFNPPFANDVRMPIRNGWYNALHFVNKHSDGLTKATKQLFTSHLEFGGCMADYRGLIARYDRIRGLEDVEKPKNGLEAEGERRVRFVNYYTASTGRPKKLNISKEDIDKAHDGAARNSAQHSRSPSRSPRISVEERRDDGTVVVTDLTDQDSPQAVPDDDRRSDSDSRLDVLEPDPSSLKEDDSSKMPSDNELSKIASTAPDLPPIPVMPTEPPPFDPSIYSEKDAKKLAEKDHARLVKTYKQAVKDRTRSIREREKLIEKREKKARQAREKTIKDGEKQKTAEEKARQRRQTKLDVGSETNDVDKDTTRGEEKTKKDKKFCVTPSKVDGKPDPTWIRVFMKDVDEVGAHCGLFFMSEAYEKLVGDVGLRIEGWVKEDQSVQVVRRLSNEAVP